MSAADGRFFSVWRGDQSHGRLEEGGGEGVCENIDSKIVLKQLGGERGGWELVNRTSIQMGVGQTDSTGTLRLVKRNGRLAAAPGQWDEAPRSAVYRPARAIWMPLMSSSSSPILYSVALLAPASTRTLIRRSPPPSSMALISIAPFSRVAMAAVG